jgi:hypothetical protein
MSGWERAQCRTCGEEVLFHVLVNLAGRPVAPEQLRTSPNHCTGCDGPVGPDGYVEN